MQVSVIIVSYNSRSHLTRCLSSVCADLGPGGEVIVVDNGSSDGSAELVAAGFPQARLVRSTNTGYAGGNNLGASLAQGEYLVFLNPDTEVEPGALAALVAPLAEGRAGLTTACIVHMDAPEIVNTCGNAVHISGLTTCRGAGQPRSAHAEPVEVAAVSGAAFAIRRALFTALSGFDERFFMYVEDTDLSLRARLAGHACLYIPAAVVRHAYAPAFSPSKVYHLDRNRHFMLLKNFRRDSYLRLLPALLLAELLTWGFMLMRGPAYWPVKLRVYRWLWDELRSSVVRSHSSIPNSAAERELLRGLGSRLAFEGAAGPLLARLAGAFFQPAFALARLPLLAMVAKEA
jgi:GT2 family glycosyltransferase